MVNSYTKKRVRRKESKAFIPTWEALRSASKFSPVSKQLKWITAYHQSWIIEIWMRQNDAWERNISWYKNQSSKSSRPEVFCKKGVLRNFAEFTEKHLCQSFFFNKVAGRVCNFIKKETVAHVFSCEISKKIVMTLLHIFIKPMILNICDVILITKPRWN